MTLLFDLDDTLVDSERAYSAGMRHVGIDPKDTTFLQARASVKASLPPLSPTARSRQLYFKKYLELKNEFSAQRHLALADAYEDFVANDLGQQWIDLKRDKLFAELKKMTPHLFIVTNETTRMQVKKLTAMDPSGTFFSGMITSEECGVEKPNPVIYQRALVESRSNKSDCIMIGDSFINDIKGAMDFGIEAIQTTEFTESKDLGPTTITQLSELPGVLRSHFPKRFRD